MILKRFKFVNKCDTGNICSVYVWTPVPNACPLIVYLTVINLYILCGFQVFFLSDLENRFLSGIHTVIQFIGQDFIKQSSIQYSVQVFEY